MAIACIHAASPRTCPSPSRRAARVRACAARPPQEPFGTQQECADGDSDGLAALQFGGARSMLLLERMIPERTESEKLVVARPTPTAARCASSSGPARSCTS